MSFIEHFQKPVQHANPVYPYAWEARYLGYDDRTPESFRLRQFDHDGAHWTREIDRARIRSLVILGHPASPIELWTPYPPPPLGPPPDAVIVKAVVDHQFTVGGGNGNRAHDVLRFYFFGFRYGADDFLVGIDPTGSVFRTAR